MLAVDISNWQGNISTDVYTRWRDAGVRTVICGTSGNPDYPLMFKEQAIRASSVGLKVEAYIWLAWMDADAFAERIKTKCDIIKASGISVDTVWLDCEDDDNKPDPDRVVELIALARDIVQERGYNVGIYTGRWWWVPSTNDSNGFTNLPLWLAHYDGNPVLESDLLPMGGWDTMYRKQYTSNGALGGVFPLDLNVEAEQVIPAPVPEPEVQPLVPPYIPLLDFYRIVTALFYPTTDARHVVIDPIEYRLLNGVRMAVYELLVQG